ncbi:AMP-binding protein [Desulfitobacterium hafniense]|nr:AMP-binding protein [Desulfitobacterium hafniense]
MDFGKWQELYDPGVPCSIRYPHLPLKDYFLQRVAEYPHRDYIIWRDIHLTYEQCNFLSRKFANSLIRIGCQKQDRIALMTGNVPEYIIALQACFKLGVIAVPLNPRSKAEELTKHIITTGCSTVVVLGSFAEKALEMVQGDCNPLENMIVIDQAEHVGIWNNTKLYGWTDFIDGGEDSEPDIVVEPEDIALLQYTGGTTGFPKASILTNANLEAGAIMIHSWFKPLLGERVIKCLAAQPLYHIMGFISSVNLNLIGGGTIILVDPPTPENVIANINLHEPNCFSAVPTLLFNLSHYPSTMRSKISKIAILLIGGSPLPAELRQAFEQQYHINIVQGYGMSEVLAIAMEPCLGPKRQRSVGLPFPDTKIKIVDAEDYTIELAPGNPGELLIKGPQVTSGYWANKIETDNSLQDGWFHTGDIVIQDEDGYLFVVDRKKDLIISSGFNVYPREIDEILYKHPAVLEACTVGIAHPKRVEAAKTYVVLKEGCSVKANDLIDFCRNHLTAYKVPVEVEFITQLPKTSIGKPDRVALRRMAKKCPR